MTCLHLFANYMAVTSLVFDTLNKDRLLPILQIYLNQKAETLPEPSEINPTETPFLGFGLQEQKFCGKNIHLGASMKHLQDCQVPLKLLRQKLESDKFLLQSDQENVYVILSESSRPEDKLRAFFTAFCEAIDPEASFDFDDFYHKLSLSGWKSSHLQISSLGWRGEFA